MLSDTDKNFLGIAYAEAKAGFDEGGCPSVISGCRKAIRLPMVKWMRSGMQGGRSLIGIQRFIPV